MPISYQRSFKGISLPYRKVESHRQRALAQRRRRVANRKRVAKLLA